MTSSKQGTGHDASVSPAVYLWLLLISLTSTPELYPAPKSSKDLFTAPAALTYTAPRIKLC